MKTKYFFTVSMLIGALALVACGSDNGSNSAIRDLAGAGAQTTPAPTAQPTLRQSQDATPPPATETPDFHPQPQPAQIMEVTRIVEVVITPTPDIQGFSAPAIDESAQPCPARFWKRGRCTATAAQIEQYAHEAQP